MAAKRLSNDRDSDQDNPAEKRTKPMHSLNSRSSIGEVLMLNSRKELCSTIEPLLRKVVTEEVDRSLKKRSWVLSRSPSLRIQKPESSNFRLVFSKNPAGPVFTGSKILDTNSNPLQILLVEKNGNTMIPVVFPYPVRIDIVAVDGDFPSADQWTREEFENKIVKEREGRRPLLTGDVSVTLRNGAAVINEIEFTDNSSWIRSRKFRIGARVARASGAQEIPRVREGITEAFVVRDHRGELYKKHHPPQLEDEVWRLEKIGKGGTFHQRLSSHGVHTVQDFLKLSVIDQQRLRKILGTGMSERMWEVTLKHARECVLGEKYYVYRGPTFIIILDPICQLVNALINGRILPLTHMNKITRSYVENLTKQAYEQWASLQEIEGAVNDTALLTQGEMVEQRHPEPVVIPSLQGAGGYLTETAMEMSYTRENTILSRDDTLEVTSGFFTSPVELDVFLRFSQQ